MSCYQESAARQAPSTTPSTPYTNLTGGVFGGGGSNVADDTCEAVMEFRFRKSK